MTRFLSAAWPERAADADFEQKIEMSLEERK
jgi:hypothetical protein